MRTSADCFIGRVVSLVLANTFFLECVRAGIELDMEGLEFIAPTNGRRPKTKASRPRRQVSPIPGYRSPLKCLRSWRLRYCLTHEPSVCVCGGARTCLPCTNATPCVDPRNSPQYDLRLDSLTYSHKINPWIHLCAFELHGTCNDDECPFQHLRDATPTSAFQPILIKRPCVCGCACACLY